ncbi:hypothetical protein CAPTEDRAFT_203338 [Capitella teleta]|uniref:DDE Tnp4 domain-containing protein n=1 Tax=Capitella teleta TaxID=283909 RepID=R7VA35_CAPTE|nr:hypothetical protein CAPTEDRAFT_203338 [Capitella teleta]|eukprot:ELU15397.1 hypothetical protein CAPTEDRAFT_203338 [Capitella teleta]
MPCTSSILFHNGAAVYHHRQDIIQFLNDLPEPNKLLKFVKFDIKETLHLAACRALGILYLHTMRPFEDLLRKGNIVELNRDLQLLYSTLSAWEKDGSIPLNLDRPVFDGAPSYIHSELGSVVTSFWLTWGFTVHEAVSIQIGELRTPAFTKGKSQLSALDVETTRKLASQRIHVERVIGVVRQRNTMLQLTIAIPLLIARTSEVMPLDKTAVACALFNFSEPIVPFY